MEWRHGGDWAGYERKYNREIKPLDFSANVSPLGVPAGVQEALREAACHADCYPDPFCRALRDAVAEWEGLLAGQIVCGNGAADLIYRIVWARKPRRALVTAPAFSEYEAALQTVGCKVDRYPLKAENGFQMGPDFLRAIEPGTDVVFLCEPNNPAGITTPYELLLEVIERCRTVGAQLIVDECFNGFLDHPEAHTLKPQLSGAPHVLLLKAFTKLYALAGVRLGYVLGTDSAFLETLYRAGPPWNVSTLAQAAGIAALEETAYVEQLRQLIQAERLHLLEGLQGMGLRVIPSEANYLLFQSKIPLLCPLRKRGILLRGCGDYAGLDETWYRTAVRTGTENGKLLAAIKEVLR
ncbi:MAG: aminotransferase class I/II-fold pyridoxal phosphate-dependent enzyme [Oscillibacter sp.]|nr:aminotransferase class I/II-fold pyridoxal phosphate-dependent enzyme [Oscillibacter sp.]